jgi:ATP-dependent Lon protease
MKAISFTLTIQKNTKVLTNKLNKKAKEYLYNEHYKMLKKEIEDTKMLEDLPYSCACYPK